jgi:hypothetical protein
MDEDEIGKIIAELLEADNAENGGQVFEVESDTPARLRLTVNGVRTFEIVVREIA